MPKKYNREMSCSTTTLRAGEPLFGTAAPTDIWFLLEYTDQWSPKILKDNKLSPEINQWFFTQFKQLSNVRLEFIKQRRPVHSTRRFYVIVADEQKPRTYCFHLNAYEELLSLKMTDMLQGAEEMEAHRVEEDLFLVCTNGKRDPCCALRGFPIFKRLESINVSEVWQCTHVGGDRFSANVLCFPHGLYFGRVDAEGADQIYADYKQRNIPLAYFRGRSFYNPPVQAAEYFLREKLNLTSLDALQLMEQGTLENEKYRISFQVISESSSYILLLQRVEMDEPRFKNCRSDMMTRPTSYLLLDCHQA